MNYELHSYTDSTIELEYSNNFDKNINKLKNIIII